MFEFLMLLTQQSSGQYSLVISGMNEISNFRQLNDKVICSIIHLSNKYCVKVTSTVLKGYSEG